MPAKHSTKHSVNITLSLLEEGYIDKKIIVLERCFSKLVSYDHIDSAAKGKIENVCKLARSQKRDLQEK